MTDRPPHETICIANRFGRQTVESDTDASQADRLLGDVEELRRRARRERRQHALWAMLSGVVSLVGAATFLLTDQLETRSCEQIESGTHCVEGTLGFDAGWVWVVATLGAVAVPFVRRYRRGSWRPSTGVWVALAIGALVVFPGVIPLLSVISPIAYPVAAAVAVSAIAARRRAVLETATAVVLAVMMLYVHFRIDPAWMLERNLGLTLFSLAVAVLAFLLAAVWHRQDHGS